MSLIQLAQIVIGSIISIGVLAAGVGYGLGKYFEGKNARKKDELDLFTKQIDALNALCEQQQKQIATLQQHDKDHTTEIGRLQGINEEKEKKIKDLTDIIANRDPQLTDFIKYITESTKNFQAMMPESQKTFARLFERIDSMDSKFNQLLSEGKIK